MQNTDMEKISENIKPQPQKVFDYYSGKLDPEEGKKIEEQLSEENAALLASVKKLLDLDKQMTELSEIDTRKAYKKVLSRIHTNRRSHIFEIFSRVAAIIVLPLIGLTGILGYFQIKDSFADITYVEVNAAPGTISKYQLPDKSYVWLNSGSWLRYPTRFSEESRRVEIRGEAYFEVAKDPECPFFVEMEGVEVRVYGTSFNVNTHQKGCIQTVLVKGSIGVKVLASGTESVIKPGQMAEFKQGKTKVDVKEVNVAVYTDWKDGIFRFENQRLEDILTVLSNWYDVDVFYQTVSVKELHFSGYMERYKDVRVILDAITLSTGVTFSIQGKTIIVSK